MLKKLFIFCFIFLLSLQVIGDSDFGWHLRVGEYIASTKSVPKTDIFSFSQPDYHYVYHSWGAEVLIYTAYFLYGLNGVSVFYALILTLSIFFLYKTVLLTQKDTHPAIFFCLTLLAGSIAGGRTRIFGLLMLTILYYFFTKFQKSVKDEARQRRQKSKLIYLIPILFFFWVNLHGSFILGIFTFAILIIANTIQKKFLDGKLFTLFLLSSLATLINPYFINAWVQAIRMFTNSFGLSSINNDWQSLINLQTSGWIFAVLVGFFALVTQLFKIKVNYLTKFLLTIFLLLSIISSRFTFALLVFFTPVATQTISYFQKKINMDALRAPPVKIASFALSSIFLLLIIKNIFSISFANKSLENYSLFLNNVAPTRFQNLYWPYQANIYIAKNLKGKKILNEPNWSGFMLLLDKDVKIFYWNAMDNFIIDNQSFAVKTLQIVNAKPGFPEELDKYQINAVFLSPTSPLVHILKQKQDWQIVYEDELAIIMTKI